MFGFRLLGSAQSFSPAGFEGCYLFCRFGILIGVADGLSNEDKQQKCEARGQCGKDSDQGFFGLAFEFGGFGLVKHLDGGAFAGFVNLGHFKLFGEEFKQGFLVFVFAVAGDVVALVTALP